MAEREGFEPSMELLTPYSLSRGAPSATRPSLQICARRSNGPADHVAVARGDVLRQPLAVLSATRPSLQICARRSNGPADHVGERDYSGLRPSPLRGCRRVNPTSASRAILRAKRHLATSRQPEIVNRVMLQDQHRCWPWSMHRARRPQSVRHSNFINPTYQSSACPFSRLIRS